MLREALYRLDTPLKKRHLLSLSWQREDGSLRGKKFPPLSHSGNFSSLKRGLYKEAQTRMRIEDMLKVYVLLRCKWHLSYSDVVKEMNKN